MAQDDMHVLIYKVLAYLYSCMKRGEEPDRTMLQSDGPLFGGVPYRYWSAIWSQIAERNLVSGIGVKWYDNSRSIILHDPEITLDGVEFMQENSMMRRAYDLLKAAKDALPFI